MCRFLGFWPGKIKNPKFCATHGPILPTCKIINLIPSKPFLCICINFILILMYKYVHSDNYDCKRPSNVTNTHF